MTTSHPTVSAKMFSCHSLGRLVRPIISGGLDQRTVPPCKTKDLFGWCELSARIAPWQVFTRQAACLTLFPELMKFKHTGLLVNCPYECVLMKALRPKNTLLTTEDVLAS
jgi:hypothetical protein